jgi:Zinc finger, C2H2 type
MPNYICDVCKVALVSAYNLRKQIRASDNFLRDLLSNCDLPSPSPAFEQRLIEEDSMELKGLKPPVSDHDPPGEDQTLPFEIKPTATVRCTLKPGLGSSAGDQPLNSDAGNDNKSFLDHEWPEQIEVNVEISELNGPMLEDDDWFEPQAPPQVPKRPISKDQPERINCCRCEETFATPGEIKPHMLDVHNIDFDPEEMTRQASFLKHVTFCNLCGNRYNSNYEVNQHKFQYKNLITCSTCGELVKKKAIANHMKRHNNESAECDICHKTFRKFYLVEHKKKVHFLVKKFECYFCPDKRFANKNKVRVHMQQHDSSFRKPVVAVCPFCKRTFEAQSHLKSHLVIHTGKER